METFLNEMKRDMLCIINEQRNIEEQLKQYGYTLMPEPPNTLHEDSGSDAAMDEYNGSDATSCEEQLERLSVDTNVKM
jgi:hypothetical protein